MGFEQGDFCEADWGGSELVRSYPLTKAPPAIRKAKLANVALVPGNLLPYKRQYQEIANSLPQGDVLIVVPPCENPGRILLERVASVLRAEGYGVTTLRADRFG